MRKKFLVDIYLAYNLGDDMFLDFLSISFPEYDFVPYHPGKNYQSFYNHYENINQFPYSIKDRIFMRLGYNKLQDYTQLAKSYDGLIFLGGGIFREESYWKELYKYRTDISLAFKKNHRKVWFIGCNFGPFSTKGFFDSYESLFKNVDKVNFRDSKSYKLFSHLNNIDNYPDLLWAYDLPPAQFKSDTVGISVINPKHKEGYSHLYKDYIDSHVKLIDELKKKGKKVTLFSFCEKEGDLEVCDDLKKIFPEIKVINYDGRIQKYLLEIGKCSHFVSARFHGCIIAIKYSMPLIAIVYSDKTENMLLDLGDDTEKINLNSIKKLSDQDFRTFDKNLITKLNSNANWHLKDL